MTLEQRIEQEKIGRQDLRGDPITGDRYYSREFAAKEWEHGFTRTWQIGGMSAQLAKPGSVITQAIGQFVHQGSPLA